MAPRFALTTERSGPPPVTTSKHEHVTLYIRDRSDDLFGDIHRVEARALCMTEKGSGNGAAARVIFQKRQGKQWLAVDDTTNGSIVLLAGYGHFDPPTNGFVSGPVETLPNGVTIQDFPIANSAAMAAIAAEFDRRLRAYLKNNPEVRVLLDLRLSSVSAEAPTADADELERRVTELLRRGPVASPAGNERPRLEAGDRARYERDPKVKAYVLYLAQGRCELCEQLGPFVHPEYLLHFLEVHHVRRLADAGPDTVDNCTAVCPNCHRRLHLGDTRDGDCATLLRKVARLRDYRAVEKPTV